MNHSHGTTEITLRVKVEDASAPEVAKLLRALGPYLVDSDLPEVQATRLALHAVNTHDMPGGRWCAWSKTYVTGDYPSRLCPSSCPDSLIETVRRDEPAQL